MKLSRSMSMSQDAPPRPEALLDAIIQIQKIISDPTQKQGLQTVCCDKNACGPCDIWNR